jgi:Tol biopolymer transport system component
VRTLIDDGQINSKPAWSLDGSTLFFHRINFAEEARFGVFKIKSDGTQTQPSRLTPVGTGVNQPTRVCGR